MSYPQELKKTVAGIAIDPQTLERVVPVTRRKDGSERKELKIRPGFTPQEDVALYKTSGQLQSARLKGYVPGATSASSSTYQAPPSLSSTSEFPSIGGGLTKAQKKNLARKNKKAEEKNARNWDSDSEDEPSGSGGKETQVAEVKAETEKKAVRAPRSAMSGIVSTLNALKVADPLPSPYAIPSPSSSPAPPPAASSSPPVDPTTTSTSTTETTAASSTPGGSSSVKKAPRPGGGLFRDLPIKPSSPGSATSPPPAASTKPAAKATTAAPRQRPEIKVRPSHGLQGLNGLVRSMAAEREGSPKS